MSKPGASKSLRSKQLDRGLKAQGHNNMYRPTGLPVPPATPPAQRYIYVDGGLGIVIEGEDAPVVQVHDEQVAVGHACDSHMVCRLLVGWLVGPQMGRMDASWMRYRVPTGPGTMCDTEHPQKSAASKAPGKPPQATKEHVEPLPTWLRGHWLQTIWPSPSSSTSSTVSRSWRSRQHVWQREPRQLVPLQAVALVRVQVDVQHLQQGGRWWYSRAVQVGSTDGCGLCRAPAGVGEDSVSCLQLCKCRAGIAGHTNPLHRPS